VSKKALLASTSVALSTLILSPTASAIEFKWGDVDGSFNSTVTAGGGRRSNDPSCSVTGDSSACGGNASTAQWAAGDNGDLNYGKGDWFTTYIKGTHELLLKAPDGWKLFTRGTWKHDFTADQTRRTELSADAKRQIVDNAELLDLWVSKDLSIGDQNARVRLGNQVISWGEALFLIGGISNNVLDYQKLQVPGTQLKEAYLPVQALSLSSSLSDTVSAEAFYQFRWRRARVAPVGSYFSASDIYGSGRVPASFSGSNFNVSGQDQYSLTGQRTLTDAQAINAFTANGDFGVPIADDKKPKDSGQAGLAVKWAPEGSTVNFGAYAMNYHDQFPVLSVINDGTAYQWSYRQNRQMYGLSANFPVGNWAIGTELSYRPKDAMSLSGCFGANGPLDVNTNPGAANCPLYKDNEKYQFSTTGLLQLQRSDNPLMLGALGADSAFLSLESAVTVYPGAGRVIHRTIDGVEVQQVAAAGYFTALNSTDSPYPIATGIGSAVSWGVVADFNWTYDGKLIQGWQVTPGITYSAGIKGDTPNYSAQFLEHNQSVNLYVLFNQNPIKWQGGINYTSYFGGSNQGVVRQYFKDRDFLGLFASYNF
jgi:hypothetical protein